MGRGDRAIVGLLTGCGLRCDELVNLTFKHLERGECRWVIVDIVVKGRRVRARTGAELRQSAPRRVGSCCWAKR
jgi:site-specific recombinase XerC